MHLSLNKQELLQYLCNQVDSCFNDDRNFSSGIIEKHFDKIIQRVEYCFSKVNNKYFYDGKQSVFNHLHGDQYSMFLYFAGNTLYREGVDASYCQKVFLLNKMLHGIDAFYEVELPDIFLFVHPLATVLGRGKYSNYFVVYQRCGIGSNHDIYPELGEHLTMHPGSAVLGNSKTGNNCEIATESLVLDTNLPDNTLYIGNPSEHKTRSISQKSSFWHERK